MAIVAPGFMGGGMGGVAAKVAVPLAIGAAGLGAGLIGSRLLGANGDGSAGDADKQAAINAALDQHIADTQGQSAVVVTDGGNAVMSGGNGGIGRTLIDGNGGYGGGGMGAGMPPEVVAELQARAQLKQARAERKAREDMVMQQMMSRGY